jgi:hypothetical protein
VISASISKGFGQRWIEMLINAGSAAFILESELEIECGHTHPGELVDHTMKNKFTLHASIKFGGRSTVSF